MERQSVRDLVVVLPGIMGSRLSKDGHEVWGLSGSALRRGIRTFGGSVRQLTLPQDLGDEHPGDGVEATGPMRDVHGLPGMSPLISGYTDLLDWLERNFTLDREDSQGTPNLIAFGYDWRLSCRYNAERLRVTVDQALGRWRTSRPERADAEVVLICHSMGGLVARHYAECLGGAEVVRRIITLGTPHRGSLDALQSLVHGIPGLSGFARSLPSLHQLLPDYACLVDGSRGLLRVDEMPALPGVDPKLLADAAEFHARIRAGSGGYELSPVTGVLQPTLTTGSYSAGSVLGLETIDASDEGGDGRVPRLSSCPDGFSPAFTPSEQHGSLQNNPGVRDAIWGWLAPPPLPHRAPEDQVRLGIRTDEYLPAGAACRVEAVVPETFRDWDALALRAELSPVDGGAGRPLARTLGNRGEGRYATEFPPPAPGLYRLTVRPVSEARASGVTAYVLSGGTGDE